MFQKLLLLNLSCVEFSVFCMVALVLSFNSAHLCAGDGNQESDEPQSPSEKFESSTSPFLKTYCVDCHGADSQESGLRFDQIGHDLSDSQAAQIWSDIFAQVQFAEMPPSDSDQPSVGERSRFVASIEAELMQGLD